MPFHDNFIGPVNPNNFVGLDWMKLPVVYGDREPGATGFTQSGGTSELTLHIGSQYLHSYILSAVGYAAPFTDVGAVVNGNAITVPEYSGINRALPLGHPRYPFMYCSGVQSVQGSSFQKMVDYSTWSQGELLDVNGSHVAPIYPVFPEYTMYDVKMGFSARTYPVLPNSVIASGTTNVTYYPPNQAIPISINQVWPEWLRYTFIKPEPKFETLSAQQGSYYFWVPPNLLGFNPAPVSQVGQIKIPYPSTRLAVTWFNVPYRFATGDGVYDSKGKRSGKTVFEYAAYTVNQNDFLGKPAGTLLFEGIQISEPQVAPFPDLTEIPAGSGKYGFINNFTCDITMYFIHRNPPPALDYKLLGYSPGGVINSYNNVYAGHNLLPDARNGKYFAGVFTKSLNAAQQLIDQTTQNTIFPSFPHELLFADPAAVMPYLP